MRKNAKALLSIVIMFGSILALGVEANSQETFSINLKPRAIVVGPIITLGDIGYIGLQDSVKRTLLKSVRIAEAPPPGESSEISLNFVKNCLKAAGFNDMAAHITGPRVIRVTTVQIEIDKAFLKEEYAIVHPIIKSFEI